MTLEPRLTVLTVMVGGLYPVMAFMLWMLFRIGTKLGGLS